MTMLIRKNVAPMIGSPVRLLGADVTVPKGVTITLGEGWTQKTNDQYVFDVPPGAAFKPLSFVGLTIGAQYRIRFVASAATGYGTMVFRPGELGFDTVIAADGAYDITFTAQDTNGVSRFLHTDVTGVSRITLSLLKLVPL